MTSVKAFARRAEILHRHLRPAFPYLTLRKLANLVLNDIELRLARPVPRSTPPYLKIEATPLCHLACGACCHSDPLFKKSLHNRMHLTLETLTRIVEPVADRLVGVNLSYNGEPMLNRELPGLIAYLHGKGICTSFPTNLSVPLSDAQVDTFVTCGLDLMQVSLDGATRETYDRYRVGGNFQLVLDNVRRLADAKKRLGVRRPFLIWKMVVFPYNEHEIAVARETHASLGFDGFEFELDGAGAESLAMFRRMRQAIVEKRKACFWAWNTSVIGWDGGVQPCCKQMNKIPLGNAARDGLRAVWRAAPYAKLRAAFQRKRYGEDMNPVCRKCLGMAETTT